MYTDISMDLSRVFFPLKTETDSSKRNVIPFISLSHSLESFVAYCSDNDF